MSIIVTAKAKKMRLFNKWDECTIHSVQLRVGEILFAVAGGFGGFWLRV